MHAFTLDTILSEFRHEPHYKQDSSIWYYSPKSCWAETLTIVWDLGKEKMFHSFSLLRVMQWLFNTQRTEYITHPDLLRYLLVFAENPNGGILCFWNVIYGINSFIFQFPIRVWASPLAQLVKNPPAMRETWVQSLGWEDPLEKGKATHSSILAWRILWTV